MKSEYQHKVLVVDGDEQAVKTIAHILRTQKIEIAFADSGELALKKIKQTKRPFSIIIAEQHLKEMKGTRVFEHAKELAPDTVRFLMSANFEAATLINAVNKGSIQRYILKPIETDSLAGFIRSGILLYESFLDNEKLLNLAKKQNTKLFDLNCELMEATKSHNRKVLEFDSSIEKIEKEIQTLSSQQSINPDALLERIENSLKNDHGFDAKKTAALFSDTIKALYDQFNELAQRNGFEMPEMEEEIK